MRTGPRTCSTGITASGASGGSGFPNSARDTAGTGTPPRVHAGTPIAGNPAFATELGERTTTASISAGNRAAVSRAASLPRDVPNATIFDASTPGWAPSARAAVAKYSSGIETSSDGSPCRPKYARAMAG